ncbi:MAG: magnesium transporter [Pseudomonadota bacterium]
MSDLQTETSQEMDTDPTLDAHDVGQIRAALATGDDTRLAEFVEALHPADAADLLEQVDETEREDLLARWPGQFDGEVLSELNEGLREEVIDQLSPEELRDAVRDLETDDVVDLVEDLDEPRQEAILEALDAPERLAIEQSLTYPEDSAGRLMQRAAVAAPEHWSVGEVIDYMRARDDLPQQFYHVFLVDPRMKPMGYVTLGRVLSSTRDTALRDITEDSFRLLSLDTPDDEVAYIFNQYHLISLPVIDSAGRLAGVITIDDAMVVLDQEHEEDMMRLAGVGEEEISDRVGGILKARLPWLFVNLLTAIAASLVIAQFDDAISAVVALAVLMPIVASMGGNAGTQSLTVAVRALATRDLTASNMARVVRREAAVGLLNGLFFAVVMGALALFWFGSTTLAWTIAVAMVVNLLVAALAGILVPVVLDRAQLDPALASGTFVTTVTDVVGFAAFLGLATLVLL